MGRRVSGSVLWGEKTQEKNVFISQSLGAHCCMVHFLFLFLSLTLSPSLPSLFTLLSFSLWEQMEHILCYISALSALRKYYNKADMPRVRTDLVCQWHLFEFVNCSVLQPCQRASFIVSGPVNTIHPWGLPAEKWNNEWKALRFLKWTRLKGQELSNWLNTVSLNNISNYYYYYF